MTATESLPDPASLVGREVRCRMAPHNIAVVRCAHYVHRDKPGGVVDVGIEAAVDYGRASGYASETWLMWPGRPGLFELVEPVT